LKKARVTDSLPEDLPHGGETRSAGDIDLIVIHAIGRLIFPLENLPAAIRVR
jgi:hypothetical protein